MKTIDFMCIGVAKSATTWLYANLLKHSEIEVSTPKEINFFNPFMPEDPITSNPNMELGLEWYHSHFDWDSDKIRGEFSTSYLKYSECSASIKSYNSKIRLIVLLRQPLERSYSHYLFLIQRSFLPPSISFEKAIELKPNIITDSLYVKQLKPFFSNFDETQIKVVLYDQIIQDPASVIVDIQRFLNVKNRVPDSIAEYVNTTKDLRHKWVHNILLNFVFKIRTKPFFHVLRGSGASKLLYQLLNKLPLVSKPEKKNNQKVPDHLHSLKNLKELFRNDIDQLEKMLKLNLSSWKNEL